MQPIIEVTDATSDQHAIIQDIAHRTWPATFGSILSEKQIAYMLEWMYSLPALHEQVTERGHRFLLAREGDTYWGYASYETNYHGEPKTKLHKIYVLPSAQGKGAGKALIDKVIQRATEAQNQALLLNVNRHNNAVQFYEKVGFRVIGHEDIDIGNGFLMQDFIMGYEF
jgi:diamine N-acetyltransferase